MYSSSVYFYNRYARNEGAFRVIFLHFWLFYFFLSGNQLNDVQEVSFMLKTYVHKLGTALYAFLLVIELNAIAEKHLWKTCRLCFERIFNIL